MSKLRAGRRVLTEVLTALAFPFLLAGIIVLPVSAVVVGEADRARAQFVGDRAFPLKPATSTWGSWIASRLRTRSIWRTDVPIYLSTLGLSAVALWISFWGFVGGLVLILEPIFWGHGVATQVGPFVPQSVVQTILAVPAGLLLLALTFVLLVGVSFLQEAVQGFVSRDEDPDLIVKIEELRTSRALLTRAFELERQRIERDLHDGAQQELVAVIMRLGCLKPPRRQPMKLR